MKKALGKFRNKKGFTLIELIVVIAVIGILVLLAAPKFLGHTKDANVSAMQADAKALSNEALVHFVDGDIDGGVGKWPAGEGTEITIGGETFIADEFDSSFEHANLANDLGDYVIVVDGDNEGEVYHLEGIPGKDEKLHHGGKLTSDE